MVYAQTNIWSRKSDASYYLEIQTGRLIPARKPLLINKKKKLLICRFCCFSEL